MAATHNKSRRPRWLRAAGGVFTGCTAVALMVSAALADSGKSIPQLVAGVN